MSEIMRAVLRMPPELWDGGAIDVAQRHAIYREAADEIERLQAIVDGLISTGNSMPRKALLLAISQEREKRKAMTAAEKARK